MLNRNSGVPGDRSLITIDSSITPGGFYISLLQRMQVAQSLAFPIYLKTLTCLIMFPSALFIFPLSCLSYLDILMRLTPKKNQAV